MVLMPKKHNSKSDKIIIGRNEKVDLPNLSLIDLKAKIDTGAFTSVIHCHKIKLVISNRKKFLYFNLLDPGHPKYEKKLFKVTGFSEKKVKNSFGASEIRFAIKTPILIAGKLINTEFTLTDRSEMKYPILLGRKLLKENFVVDVSKVNQGIKANLNFRDKLKVKAKTKIKAKTKTKSKTTKKK
jgi:hypothetical protein